MSATLPKNIRIRISVLFVRYTFCRSFFQISIEHFVSEVIEVASWYRGSDELIGCRSVEP